MVSMTGVLHPFNISNNYEQTAPVLKDALERIFLQKTQITGYMQAKLLSPKDAFLKRTEFGWQIRGVPIRGVAYCTYMHMIQLCGDSTVTGVQMALNSPEV